MNDPTSHVCSSARALSVGAKSRTLSRAARTGQLRPLVCLQQRKGEAWGRQGGLAEDVPSVLPSLLLVTQAVMKAVLRLHAETAESRWYQ
jgi:hypothetical protein